MNKSNGTWKKAFTSVNIVTKSPVLPYALEISSGFLSENHFSVQRGSVDNQAFRVAVSSLRTITFRVRPIKAPIHIKGEVG
jgi:hypothetical protein